MPSYSRSEAALLLAESRLRRAVASHLATTAERESGYGSSSLLRLQPGLLLTLAGIFELGRQASRRASAETLRAQLEAIDGLPRLDYTVEHDTAADRIQAAAAAGAIASGLVLMALPRVEGGKPIRPALRIAAREQKKAVARHAATEASRAFSDEREAILLHNYQTNARAFRDANLVKVWSSALDHRTCGPCRDLDGTEVPINADFPGGRTPGFHPLCRCLIEVRQASQRMAA